MKTPFKFGNLITPNPTHVLLPNNNFACSTYYYFIHKYVEKAYNYAKSKSKSREIMGISLPYAIEAKNQGLEVSK